MYVERFALYVLRIEPTAVMDDDGAFAHGVGCESPGENGAPQARNPHDVARLDAALLSIDRVDEAEFAPGNLGLPERNCVQLTVKPRVALRNYA